MDERDGGELFDVGVLLVHGIGDQERGATLVDFGTPLVEWLVDRAALAGSTVRVVEAEITTGEPDPAHAVLTLEGAGFAQRWMMAESWWAKSFVAPPFADLARWGLAVAPWTFGSHFGERLRRQWERRAESWHGRIAKGGRLAVAFLSLLGSLALSVGVAVALVMLLWLSFIPWQRLREAIAATQLRISSWLGDSYLFVARPIEFAAILAKVRRDLAWLSTRCRRVAVVAHSQGAAVASYVLAGEPHRADLLITFGSGLRKLEQQKYVRAYPQLIRGAGLSILGLLFTGIGFIVVPRVARMLMADMRVFADAAILLAYPAIGLTLLAAGIRDFMSIHDPESLTTLRRAISKHGVKWIDVHSSADPVPNGPLRDDEALPPQSIPIVNLGSIFRDHGAYWQNRDVFVSYVANALLRLARLPVATGVDPKTLDDLAKRRRWRVTLLRSVWWATVAGIAAFFIRYQRDWLEVVRWTISSGAPSVAEFLRIRQPEIPSGDAWWHSVGLLVLVIVTYGLVRAGWDDWNESDMAKVVSVRHRRSADWAFGITLGIHLVVIIAGTAGRLFAWMSVLGVATAVGTVIAVSGREKEAEPLPGPQPRAIRALSFVFSAYMVVAAIAAFGAGALSLIGRVRSHVMSWGVTSPGWSVMVAITAILVGLIIAGTLLGGMFELIRRRKAARLTSPSSPLPPPPSP